MGSGCGSVGRMVAAVTTDPRFESSHPKWTIFAKAARRVAICRVEKSRLVLNLSEHFSIIFDLVFVFINCIGRWLAKVALPK